MKKKLLVLAMTFALVFASLGLQAKAADTVVNVTISDGKLVLVNYAVTVTDTDNDGALTINDALYLAHEAKFEGGAAAGYGSAVGSYGLMLTKLWGIENGGSYGYYVNNTSAMGLADAVKNGDSIVAFVYTDTTAFSDMYSFFNKTTASAKAGDEISLTLTGLSYDASWQLVEAPVANAVITINGSDSNYKTDANGKVTLTFSAAGEYVISAKLTEGALVPPACVANVAAALPSTGDTTAVVMVGGFAMLLALALVLSNRKESYEK